jgi:starch-binding outer membrane protein, SusD/RagB family
MKKIRTAAVLLGAAVLGAACSDILQVEPTSTITVTSFWRTPDDARGGLNGMYVRLRGEAASNLYLWGGARSEELGIGLQASEGRERYFLNTLDATVAGPNWLRLYTVIHDANLIIKYVPRIAFTQEAEKRRMLAQAHAMRAYTYFVMARTWGGVPLVTEPTEGFEPGTAFRPRADVGEVFALIKADLEEALALFPDDGLPTCRCQWSRPAVNALKGDVFLWAAKRQGGGNADLATALAALQQVQQADVGLLADFRNVFSYTNKGNREILMAVRFQDLESGASYNADMYVRDDQIPTNVNPRARTLLGVGGGLNRWAPSAELRAQFTDDDRRKDATFVEMYRVVQGDSSSYYGSAVLKYRGFVEAGTRRFQDDVILYRYADVLLLIAEAKNALGQDPSPEMNLVRQRAYGPAFGAHTFVSGTREANDAAILQERLRELAFEGKRWWDLVRFGRAFELVPSLGGREAQDHLLLWPISQGTLSQNPQVRQNPGY